MAQSVERALVDVAIDKGGLNLEEAEEFWKRKKAAGQYTAVSVEALFCLGCNETIVASH